MSGWRCDEGGRGRTISVTVAEISLLVTPRMLSKAFASEPKGSNENVAARRGGRGGREVEGVKKPADPSH
jgi:hypothetical protein